MSISLKLQTKNALKLGSPERKQIAAEKSNLIKFSLLVTKTKLVQIHQDPKKISLTMIPTPSNAQSICSNRDSIPIISNSLSAYSNRS